MQFRRLLLPAAASVAVTFLAACGGGGNSSPTPPTAPTAPVTSAAPVASAAPMTSPTPVAALPAPIGTATLVGSTGFTNLNASSRTVYVFDNDLAGGPNQSSCNAAGGCSSTWPAVAAVAGVTYTNGFATFTRTDGTIQVSFNGRALYNYSGDSAAGQTNGDGLGGIWHVARPTTVASAPAPSPSPSAPPGISY